MKSSVLVIAFLFLSTLVFGQSGAWTMVNQKGQHFKALSAHVEPNTSYSIVTDFPFKGFVVKYSSDQTPDGISVQLNDLSFDLTEDPHWEDEHKSTGLITVDSEQFVMELFTGSLSGTIEVHLINGSYSRAVQNFRFDNSQNTEACDEPQSVPQSVWRDGLPLPNTSRSFTNVKHLIVHHSAGTNTSSDWIEVVRSIYIFHTETRGWSDVGYNYLIDPNGILYKGRDPVGGAQDDVLGAHFCAKNSGTMGTCLMGTYTTVPPSDESIATLESLLAWKANKESLNVFATAVHQGTPLPHIAGHRDGCSTECPGQMTYEKLGTIRTDTNVLMEPCGSATEPPDPVDPVTLLQVYPNPVLGFEFTVHVPLQYRQIKLVSARGKTEIDMILDKDETELTIEVRDLQSGLYTLVFLSGQTTRTAKLIIAH